MLGAVAVGGVVQGVVVLKDGGFHLLIPAEGKQAAHLLLQAALAGALAGEGVLHAGGYLQPAGLHGIASKSLS